MGARAGLSPAAGRAPDGGADGRTRAPHRVLVVSTTHDADHPRLRDGTVAALAADPGLVVRYATPPPGPERRDDHEWVALPVARPARALAALAQALRRDVDVVSLHGASLLGVGMAVRAVRRVPVVLDVDEDLPERILMAEA